MGRNAPHARQRQRSFALLAGAAIGIVVIIAAAYFLLFYGSQNSSSSSSTTILTSYSTSVSTTSVSSSTSSTTSTSSTATTSVATALKLPPPSPDSQLARQGSNATITDAGASGGTPPYGYQWLGAVRNVSANFTASYGNFLCVNTAQSSTCNFQTNFGQNTLEIGVNYLKLRAVDSSIPMQSVNSSVASVDVIS